MLIRKGKYIVSCKEPDEAEVNHLSLVWNLNWRKRPLLQYVVLDTRTLDYTFYLFFSVSVNCYANGIFPIYFLCFWLEIHFLFWFQDEPELYISCKVQHIASNQIISKVLIDA